MLPKAFHTILSYLSITQALLIGIVTVLVIRWAFSRRKNFPPGPTPLPLIGNALDFRGNSMTEKTDEWIRRYGPLVTFYSGRNPSILIGSIETLMEAYTERGTDFADKLQNASLKVISDGGDVLFAGYSEAVKYRRKIAMQALRQYLTGSQLTERIHEAVQVSVAGMLGEKGIFNPHPHISNAVFNVIHVISFGYTRPVEDPEFKRIMSHFDETGGQLGGFWEDWFDFLRHFPTKSFQEFADGFAHVREYVKKQVAERKMKMDYNNPTTLTDNILLAKKQIEEGEKELQKADFTDEHASLLILDVFFAGTDTTKDTLDWIFLILSSMPDVQRKIQEEIDSVIGDEIPGREHRPGLVYTEAFVMEAMRMYPVAPMGLQHLTLRDTQVGGYKIPKNTEIVVNQFSILNDPKHWENPRTFRPERFLEDDGKTLKPRPKSWIPFSVGPRNCIGEFMAKQNILFTIAGILQKLSFASEPGVKPNFTPQEGWLTYNARPYKVIVKPRRVG